MNPVIQLLLAYRKHYKMTQQKLVTELSQFTNEFQSINTVTLSRWETGTTTPSLNKKKLLLNFLVLKGCLENNDCHNIAKEHYEKLIKPLSNIFTYNYQYLIGNLPERLISKCVPHDLKEFLHKDEHIEHIIDIEVATNSTDYYTLTPDTLGEWCHHPSSLSIICERKKQHLGHFIMFKIKNHVAKEIALHKRSEFDLNNNDFCDVNENGTYYIHALYGRSPKIAAELNVKAYLHLLDHINTVDNIMIFSSRTDGVLLTQDYGIKEVAHGVDEKYEFEWHGMLSPVEDILFSDTVVKLIF